MLTVDGGDEVRSQRELHVRGKYRPADSICGTPASVGGHLEVVVLESVLSALGLGSSSDHEEAVRSVQLVLDLPAVSGIPRSALEVCQDVQVISHLAVGRSRSWVFLRDSKTSRSYCAREEVAHSRAHIESMDGGLMYSEKPLEDS
jgi:hypothetical protein